jgi:hypothetical protein
MIDGYMPLANWEGVDIRARARRIASQHDRAWKPASVFDRGGLWFC